MMSVNILNQKPEKEDQIGNWRVDAKNIEELILNKEIMDNIEMWQDGLYWTR
jgi:hypothetical protein